MNPEKARKQIQNTNNETFLGSRRSKLGVEEHVWIQDRTRLTHVLNLGPTGHGKSQLMLHVALQDAYKGRGFCVVNPKGGLIDELLRKIPEDRINDIFYINPGRGKVTPVNILEPYTHGEMSTAEKENQKEIIVSDLIALFRRLSENWGDQFGRVLETILRAHLDLNIEHGESNTLIDVYRVVVDPDALTELIGRTWDPVIREQLIRVKEDMSSYDMEPLQRRLNDFLMKPTVRRFIGEEDSEIDFLDAVNKNKIILVDVRKSDIGATVSKLIGAIVITKVWAAAQSHIARQPDREEPFFLFVDELQNYGGEGSNFANILSEAREYRLGCWLATQYLRQLPIEMRRSITNNCRTKICFDPSGSEDLSRIARMFQGVERDELTALGKYRAAVQTPSENATESAVFFNTYPPWESNRTGIDRIKEIRTPQTDSTEIQVFPSLGRGSNSGGETHTQLLKTAKDRLEERGFQVELLYQDTADEKPDGEVYLPSGSVAHLEAEHSTLSKPAKVLKNLVRAAEQGRECFFVVDEQKVEKLVSIVSDPVNRSGGRQNSNDGYSYYLSDGEEFTQIDKIKGAEYRIIEVVEDGSGVNVLEPDEVEMLRVEKPLREKDREVLRCIKRGKDDVQKITSATGLENGKVNYCFTKLEQEGLIAVEKPDGMVERVVDGQKRVFEAPKRAELTDLGERYTD